MKGRHSLTIFFWIFEFAINGLHAAFQRGFKLRVVTDEDNQLRIRFATETQRRRENYSDSNSDSSYCRLRRLGPVAYWRRYLTATFKSFGHSLLMVTGS